MKKSSFKDDYEAAGTSSQQQGAQDGSGGFTGDYDSAQPQGDGSGDQSSNSDPDNDGDLDIPQADVQKMQQLKDSGDMAGLGQYVAQFLK